MGTVVSDADVTVLQSLLQGVNLLGAKTAGDDGAAVAAKDDPGAQALESTITGIAKIAGTGVAALGGVSAVGAAIGSFFTSQPTAVRVATVGGASVVFAAACVAVALIVLGDLRARRTGQVAIYQARAAIVVEYLRRAGEAAGSVVDGSAGGTSSAGSASAGSAAVGSVAVAPLTGAEVALIALAVAHRPVRVIVKGNQDGTLAGISGADGAITLYVQCAGEGSDWYAPKDLRLEALKY